MAAQTPQTPAIHPLDWPQIRKTHTDFAVHATHLIEDIRQVQAATRTKNNQKRNVPGNTFDALAQAVLSYVDRASKKIDNLDLILDRVDTILHATKQQTERFGLWSNNPTNTGAPGDRHMQTC